MTSVALASHTEDAMPSATKGMRRCRRSWSDLPEDLLGNVIDRLPGFGDRLRFRTVCANWRLAERTHAQSPPCVPWLTAAGYCVSIHDAAVHRVALPDDARAAACRGSLGNWLVLVPVSPPPYRPFLLNAFTMDRIELPVWTGGTITKVVLSSPPDSAEGCTIAAIAGCEFSCEVPSGSIAVCRLRGREGGGPSSPAPACRAWWCITQTFYLQDIAFFEGKLHAIDAAEQNYVFENDKLEQMRSRPLFHRPQVVPLCAHNRYYLVPCHGRLLRVCRSFGVNRVPGGAQYYSIGFEVSAVSTAGQCYPGRGTPPPPVPIKSFAGHALFVGDACCRAFPIASEDSKIRENQICYADDESNASVLLGGTVQGVNLHRPLRSLQSYDIRTYCFRRFQPARTMGPWQCVTLQRLLHRTALPPPPVTQWGTTLLLWEVMSSLGASRTPCYTRLSQDPGTHAMQVSVHVYDQSWHFTQKGRSEQEATQEVAREAVSFLRSRYRSVLDESPWSAIPYYHRHVSEDEDDEPLEDGHS